MITSVQNPIVKEVIALREPKARRESGLTVIDGRREVKRAQLAGIKIQKLIYSPDAKIEIKGVSGIEVSAKVFEKLAYGQRHDGVFAIAQVKLLKLQDLKLSSNALVVVVESVEKPGNLGAILRTCDGAGVDALFVGDPKTDIYNPNVVRASVGTVFTVPVVADNNENISAFLKAQGIKAVGAFPDAKDVYTRVPLKGPLAIVLGTEDKGLSAFWQKHCQLKVKIPMHGQADSLNVSVSAAILIYEALRQRPPITN